MNSVLLDLGFFQLRWYSLLMIIAVLLAGFLIEKEAKRFNINKDFIFNLVFWTIIIGFIGARIYFVIFNWNYYDGNFSEIIKTWHGGLAIHGGIIAGALTIYIYSKRKNARPMKMVDLIVPGLLLGQAIGRWGNFFNQEAHGAATTLTNLQNLHIPTFIIEGMNIDGIYYHPTFFYESLWCFVGLILILIIRRNKYIKIGQVTSIYLMWYSVGRFFIEISRTDALMFGGFKVAQIVSIVMFITGLISFYLLSRKGKFEYLYNEIGSDDNIRF